MKKIISLLICIVLLVGIAIPAYAATDIDAIKPSGTTIIAGVTGEDVPIQGPLPNYNAGPTAFVVLAPYVPPGINVTEDDEAATVNKEDKAEPVDDTQENITINETDLPEDATLAEQIFLLINDEREKQGLDDLDYNEDLQNAVDIRVKECATLFSHTRPDGTYFDTAAVDIDYTHLGENLISCDDHNVTAQQLVEAWMNSKGHRENILDSKFTSTAIAVYETDDMIYAAQWFMG